MIFVSAILRNSRACPSNQVGPTAPVPPRAGREEYAGLSSAPPGRHGLVAKWRVDPLTDRLECCWTYEEHRAVFWSDPAFFERIEAEFEQTPLGASQDLERILRAHRHWRRRQASEKSPAARNWNSARAGLHLTTSHASCLLARLFAWSAAYLLRLVLSGPLLGRHSKRRAHSLLRLANRLNHAASSILLWQLHRSAQHLG